MRALALPFLSIVCWCCASGSPGEGDPRPSTGVCPRGVQLFRTADRVGKPYREVALLRSVGDSAAGELRSRRERAAALGANGIILSAITPAPARGLLLGDMVGRPSDREGAVVAIWIPADTQTVREICEGAAEGVVRAAEEAGPDALGFTLHGAAAALADSQRQSRAAADSARRRGLALDREMRQALSDLTRLRIVGDWREIRPGVMALTLGDAFSTATSTEYNLRRLHHAYAGFLDYEVPAVLELWRDGRKLGEFTRDGLLLGPTFSDPR